MRTLLLSLGFLMGGVAVGQTASPSPQALAACDGRSEGAECTVTLEDGEHTGVCLRSPRDAAPTCMPKPLPPPPQQVPASVRHDGA
jgi:hypothetical protein